jgi:hypothetical protein
MSKQNADGERVKEPLFDRWVLNHYVEIIMKWMVLVNWLRKKDDIEYKL